VAVEGTNEQREQSDLRRERYALLRQLRRLTRDPTLAQNDEMWEGRAVAEMHAFENILYESFKHGVTPRQNDVWSFWNAVFYCGTIYTTIGKSLSPIHHFIHNTRVSQSAACEHMQKYNRISVGLDTFDPRGSASRIIKGLRPFRTNYGNVKVKLSLCLPKYHIIKAYWGSGDIDPHILKLISRCRWTVSFTPRSLYPQGKIPRYQLDRRMGRPQSRSGRGGSCRESNPSRPARSLLTILTELSPPPPTADTQCNAIWTGCSVLFNSQSCEGRPFFLIRHRSSEWPQHVIHTCTKLQAWTHRLSTCLARCLPFHLSDHRSHYWRA
jgi:hypothetical protein